MIQEQLITPVGQSHAVFTKSSIRFSHLDIPWRGIINPSGKRRYVHVLHHVFHILCNSISKIVRIWEKSHTRTSFTISGIFLTSIPLLLMKDCLWKKLRTLSKKLSLAEFLPFHIWRPVRTYFLKNCKINSWTF